MNDKIVFVSINNERISCQIVNKIPQGFYKIGSTDKYIIYTKDKLFKKDLLYYAIQK